jgi:two-component system, NarL family, response regulator YdfI
MNAMIRLVVVDDHPVVREGLRLMVETEDDIELVGDAADGNAALRLIGETQPDVVLMDLRMPGMDGLTAIEEIRRQWPQIAVVILTTYNEDELMLRGLQSGACGYLLKDVEPATLFRAVRSAARGETLLQPETMSRLLGYMRSAPVSSPTPANVRNDMILTERECAVLAAVAQGMRSKEIGAMLGVAERTVRAHLATIFVKLGVDSRASAVAVAIRRGLLPSEGKTDGCDDS